MGVTIDILQGLLTSFRAKLCCRLYNSFEVANSGIPRFKTRYSVLPLKTNMDTDPKFRPASVMSLRTKIREDHLTCPICMEGFDKPKALPCVHSFCQGCLTDFIVSRGYETKGQFPCPVCQKETIIPAGGVGNFPDNHLLSSLLDTVEKKPTVPPRHGGISGNGEYM